VTTATSVDTCTGIHACSQSQDTPGIAPTIEYAHSPQPPIENASKGLQQEPHQLYLHDEAQQAIPYACHMNGMISTPPSHLLEGDRRSTSASPQMTPPRSRLLHLAPPIIPHKESVRILPTFEVNLEGPRPPSCSNDYSSGNAPAPDTRTGQMTEYSTNMIVFSDEEEDQTFTVSQNISPNDETPNQRIQDKPIGPSPSTVSSPPKYRNKAGYRKYVLKYIDQPTNQKRLSYFHSASPSYDLHDSWGHSLESIDASSTFRIFLQNPNGLSLYESNLSLMKDLETCQNYGAAVISLPETNVNWELPGQRNTLSKLLSRNFDHTSIVTSRASEPFHSSYQPGGTATIVCNNWTSRIISKGLDPHGLGRWSYVIL
jgi:hypothetical protein